MHINTDTIQNETDALKAANELIAQCERIGVHLTITTESLTPLAMGNIRMVGDVRRASKPVAH